MAMKKYFEIRFWRRQAGYKLLFLTIVLATTVLSLINLFDKANSQKPTESVEETTKHTTVVKDIVTSSQQTVVHSDLVLDPNEQKFLSMNIRHKMESALKKRVRGNDVPAPRFSNEKRPGVEVIHTLRQDEIRLSMEETAEYVHKQCQNLSMNADLSEKDSIILPNISRTLTSMRGVSYLFTPLAKCGFTSWIYIFYQSASRVDQLQKQAKWAWENNFLNVHLKKRELTSVDNTKQKYQYRVLIVRNPYDRLLSAYLNKAVHADGLYTKTYQKPCHWLTLKHKEILTFSQFVDCILEKAKRENIVLSSRQAGVALDMHWMPQVHLSLPCLTEYNLVAKYDRFRESTEYLIGLLKLNTTVPEVNISNRGEFNSTDYYHQLLPKQILGLQALYKYDFEIFGFQKNPPI